MAIQFPKIHTFLELVLVYICSRLLFSSQQLIRAYFVWFRFVKKAFFMDERAYFIISVVSSYSQ